MQIADTISINHGWVSTVILLEHLGVVGAQSNTKFAPTGDVYVPANERACIFKNIHNEQITLQLENSKVYFVLRKDGKETGRLVGEFMKEVSARGNELRLDGLEVFYPVSPTSEYLRVGLRLDQDTIKYPDIVRLIAMKEASKFLVELFNRSMA